MNQKIDLFSDLNTSKSELVISCRNALPCFANLQQYINMYGDNKDKFIIFYQEDLSFKIEKNNNEVFGCQTHINLNEYRDILLNFVKTYYNLQCSKSSRFYESNAKSCPGLEIVYYYNQNFFSFEYFENRFEDCLTRNCQNVCRIYDQINENDYNYFKNETNSTLKNEANVKNSTLMQTDEIKEKTHVIKQAESPKVDIFKNPEHQTIEKIIIESNHDSLQNNVPKNLTITILTNKNISEIYTFTNVSQISNLKLLKSFKHLSSKDAEFTLNSNSEKSNIVTSLQNNTLISKNLLNNNNEFKNLFLKYEHINDGKVLNKKILKIDTFKDCCKKNEYVKISIIKNVDDIQNNTKNNNNNSDTFNDGNNDKILHYQDFLEFGPSDPYNLTSEEFFKYEHLEEKCKIFLDSKNISYGLDEPVDSYVYPDENFKINGRGTTFNLQYAFIFFFAGIMFSLIILGGYKLIVHFFRKKNKKVNKKYHQVNKSNITYNEEAEFQI